MNNYNRLMSIYTGRGISVSVARVLAERKVRRTELTEYCDEWMTRRDSARFGMIISGDTGYGKTFAASMLVARPEPDCDFGAEKMFSAWERHPQALAVHATKLGTTLAAVAYNRRDDMEPLIREVPLLLIDDLGREVFDPNGYVKAGLSELITYRFDNEKRTIFTTNLQLDQLEKRYDNVVIDRIGARGVHFISKKYMRGDE